MRSASRTSAPAQRVEEPGDDGATQSRLEVLDEGVVWLALVAYALRFCTLELDDLFEPGPENVEASIGTRRCPRLLRQGGRAGDFFHQMARHSDRPVVLPAQGSHVHRRG